MDTLLVKLDSLDENVRFAATARDNPGIVIDYFPPLGTGAGYTSLELLMAAFGSCLSTTVLTVLRHRMQKTVEGVRAEVRGTVRDEHPKTLQHMQVFLAFKAGGLSEQEVRQALRASEEGLCPVWAMLRGNVDVDVDVSISG